MKYKFKINKKTGWLAAFAVAFIAAVCMANVIVNFFSEKFSWYFYTTPVYEHEIGNSSEHMFEGIDSDVYIYFCMETEELEKQQMYNLVYRSAVQFAKKYDFVKLPEPLNVYRDEKVNEYIYEGGSEPVNSVTRSSVIFDCPGKKPIIATLSDFFRLDSSGTILSYRGEEVMSYIIRRAVTDSTKKALFTNNHGESSTESMYTAFLYSGYDVGTVDLNSSDIPDGTEFIIISKPIYDFEKVEEGAAVKAEIEKLKEFMNSGGNVLVILNPYTEKLQNLENMLSEYGMSRGRGIVSDNAESIAVGGRAITVKYADTEGGRAFNEKLIASAGKYTVFAGAAPIVTDSTKNSTVQSIFTASDSAYIDINGEKTDGREAVVMASAKSEGGGTLILTASTDTFTSQFMETDSYLNRNAVYAMTEIYGTVKAPIGATQLAVSHEKLENLTARAANLYAVLLCGVIPLAVAVTGTVIIIKRKNR